MAINSVILGLTGLVFCTWAVSLAGIASVQQACDNDIASRLYGVNGFTAGLSCMSFYRYYWFIICIELVLIVGLGASLASSAFAKTRFSFVGLFAVATLLYISMTDSFLSAQSVTDDMPGSIKHRVRTLVAGGIMTATVNCILIIALGTVPTEEEAAVAAKTADV